MDLMVLDKNLNAIAVLDLYKSFIWTDRFQECGDFEIYATASDAILNTVKQDYYLQRRGSDRGMIVEKILIESDVEDGDMVTITGRSLESILDRRVIWGLMTFSGNFQEAIKSMLYACIISPSKPERKISNFIFEASTDPAITSLTIDAQYTGDNLYDIITALCVERGVGFKVTLNNNKQFVFKLYAGVDRSYDQTANPYVIFSPNFDNIISSNYMESREKWKNVTLVGGEGEGAARRYTGVGDTSGLDRRETFTDARDVSSEIDEDLAELYNWTTYPGAVTIVGDTAVPAQGCSQRVNANFDTTTMPVSNMIGRVIRVTLPTYTKPEEGADTNIYGAWWGMSDASRVVAQAFESNGDTPNTGGSKEYEFTVPTGAASFHWSRFSQTAIDNDIYYGDVDDFTCFAIKLSNDEYISLLRQRGKETLAENTELISFEGQAETSAMFRYDEDFSMGDIVQVEDKYGHLTKSRILELVISEDENGTSTYPTFENVTYEDPDEST